MATINIEDLKELNILWRKMYPYLVAQIIDGYRRHSGSMLELGPFSGGISLELAALYPGFDITIADELADVVDYLRREIKAAGPPRAIAVTKTGLNHLTFSDSQFDLVVFRGAFFFLPANDRLLGEVFRVLKAGGFAFIGGGYGRGVPQQLIDEIAPRSKVLNDRLGRRWVSLQEMEAIVRRAQLDDNCQISQEGGVWLNIRK